MNGGYVMIDCTGLDLLLGDTPQTVTGLHARIAEAVKTGKALYANNCIWGEGKPVTPVQVFAIYFADIETYIVTASTLQVIVPKNDIVTIVNMAPTNRTVNATKSAKK